MTVNKKILQKTKSILLLIGYFFIFILCQQSFYNSRIPSSIPAYESPSINASALQKWGYETHYAAVKFEVENSEMRTYFHSDYGIIGNIRIAFSYPENLIQGFVETTVFWLTLLLAFLFERLISHIISKSKYNITIFIVCPILLFGYVSNIYLDYKYFNIPPEMGWYYPVCIILFAPIWLMIKKNWKGK